MDMEKKEKYIESEIDYKNIAKHPIRVFPIVFVYVFTIALLLGIYFVSQLDAISFNRVPGTSLDTLNVVREVKMQKGGIKPSLDLNALKNRSAEFVAKGKKLYLSTCTACHGTDGKGSGVVAAALNPKPRNFYSKDGWTNGRTFSDMYKTLNDGVPGTGMAGYKYLPPADRIAMILYIRTFTEFPKITDNALLKMNEVYHFSKGVRQPNHIPIKLAIQKIVDENGVLKSKILKSLKSKSITEMDGAKIFAQYCISPKKILPVLILNFRNVKTVDDFISSISYSPEKYGFKNSVINLSSKQWVLLFSYFRKITSAVFPG